MLRIGITDVMRKLLQRKICKGLSSAFRFCNVFLWLSHCCHNQYPYFSGRHHIIKLAEDHIHDQHGNWFTPDGQPPPVMKREKLSREERAALLKKKKQIMEKVAMDWNATAQHFRINLSTTNML